MDDPKEKKRCDIRVLSRVVENELPKHTCKKRRFASVLGVLRGVQFFMNKIVNMMVKLRLFK